MVPTHVVERSARGDFAVYDIYSRLLKDRIVFLGEEITDQTATCIIAQFLHLSFVSREDIHFYIMSPGGYVNAGLAIYDTMQYIPCDVRTYCVGEAASMASVLLAAGAPKKRYALPSSRMMVHQPWTHMGSMDARDVSIHAAEINAMKDMIYDRLSRHTGRSKSRIEKDCDRDKFMSAQEAVRYGLVDSIIERASYDPRA